MASGGRLIDIENEIKALIADDPSLQNPLIFEKIYDLIRLWLLRNRKVTDYNILDEIAITGAEMLLMKIFRGGCIHSWLGYISMAYQSFIREYKKLCGVEILDIENNPELFEQLNQASISASTNTIEISSMLDSSVISSIMVIVDKVMDEDSIFQKYTRRYSNARLAISIMLLTNNRDDILFADWGDHPYIRFLYNVIKERIKEAVCNVSDVDTVLNYKTMCASKVIYNNPDTYTDESYFEYN